MRAAFPLALLAAAALLTACQPNQPPVPLAEAAVLPAAQVPPGSAPSAPTPSPFPPASGPASSPPSDPTR